MDFKILKKIPLLIFFLLVASSLSSQAQASVFTAVEDPAQEGSPKGPVHSNQPSMKSKVPYIVSPYVGSVQAISFTLASKTKAEAVAAQETILGWTVKQLEAGHTIYFLMDHEMPYIDGIELTSWLRQELAKHFSLRASQDVDMIPHESDDETADTELHESAEGESKHQNTSLVLPVFYISHSSNSHHGERFSPFDYSIKKQNARSTAESLCSMLRDKLDTALLQENLEECPTLFFAVVDDSPLIAKLFPRVMHNFSEKRKLELTASEGKARKIKKINE